jgi:hypothetical protein
VFILNVNSTQASNKCQDPVPVAGGDPFDLNGDTEVNGADITLLQNLLDEFKQFDTDHDNKITRDDYNKLEECFHAGEDLSALDITGDKQFDEKDFEALDKLLNFFGDGMHRGVISEWQRLIGTRLIPPNDPGLPPPANNSSLSKNHDIFKQV